MQENQHLTAATVLAKALNEEDYSDAEEALVPDCSYTIDGSVMHGRAAIIESYREIGDWVKATFDRYEYSSEVTADGDHQAVISYRDQIWHGDHELDHRCKQIIKANSNGKIVEIEHINLPGEPEKVRAFNAACGVSKPQN